MVAYPRTEEEIVAVLDWAGGAQASVTPFGGGTVTSGQVVELFSDPGTNVILRVDRDSPAGAVNVFFSVSGYLQDVP